MQSAVGRPLGVQPIVGCDSGDHFVFSPVQVVKFYYTLLNRVP